ncbi:MAG: molecular chaperone HtpG [Solobacterium sp.]|nr:molecular chaperone HtpG [Solobacterium sp.]
MAKKQFKAESKRLLELMINSIYTNREIFLRELISNASDALDKRYYEGLTDKAKNAAKKDLWIKICRDKDARTLTIEDTGIGMNAEELEKNLGTIARSGSREFQEALEKDTSKIDIIGQFGVGFYSAFMVSKQVTVESRPAGSEEAFQWVSSGEDGYTITPITKDTVGTKITLELKDDTEDEKYSEFLEEYKIRSLVKKYSDYVRYPIKMDVTKSIPDPTDEKKTIDTVEEETLNSMVPLWKKNKNKISQEDYNEFYKGKFSDWEDPQKVLHYNVEGNVSYTALLYIPSKTPFNFYNTDYESGLQLYSKGVFILDNAKDLLPECYRFIKGLVDSDDLSLNISREILQQDRQVKALAKSIDKKITKMLEDMLEKEREEYEKFFANFGLNLKYSIYKSYGMEKEKLQDLLLYRSSNEGKFVTLKEYRSRMKEDQKEIYYVCGETMEDIEKLPVLSRVKNKGYEILYFTDAVDEFVIRMMNEYDGKTFKSVSEADLDLDSEEEKKARETTAEENKDLLEAMKQALESEVSEVRISSRLEEDPVCIVADQGMSIEMEKVLSQDPMNRGMKATKILEINPNHAIFKKLQEVYAADPGAVKDYAEVLYDQARLIEGLPIEDPAAYARRIVDLMVHTELPKKQDAEKVETVEAEIVE